MHPWRAGADHDTVQVIILHGLMNQFLAALGTHIFIISSKSHVRNRLHGGNYLRNIHGGGNITAAPADKHTYLLHLRYLLLVKLPEYCYQRLLGHFRIKIFQLGGVIFIGTLLPDGSQP